MKPQNKKYYPEFQLKILDSGRLTTEIKVGNVVYIADRPGNIVQSFIFSVIADKLKCSYKCTRYLCSVSMLNRWVRKMKSSGKEIEYDPFGSVRHHYRSSVGKIYIYKVEKDRVCVNFQERFTLHRQWFYKAE